MDPPELPRDDLVRAIFPGAELRSDPDDDGKRTLAGHFAVFDQWSEIRSVFEGNFMERLAPGAFKKTFRENRAGMRVLFDHGHDPNIGNKVLGPIAELREDETGAAYEVPLFDTEYNRELLPGLEAGVYGASFRFRVMKEDIDDDPGPSDYNPKGLPERTITEAMVREFGPVTFPQYEGATAGVRSMTDDYIVARVGREKMEALAGRLKLKDGAPFELAAYQSAFLAQKRDQPDTAAKADTTAYSTTIVGVGQRDAGAHGTGTITTTTTAAADALEDQEPVKATPDAESRATTPAAPDAPASQTEGKDMKTLEELRARKGDITSRLQEIHKEHGIGGLPDDIRQEFDELVEERKKLEADEKDFLDREATLAEFEGRQGNEKPTNGRVESRAGRTGGSRLPDDIFAIEEYRMAARNSEDLRDLLTEGAKRAVEVAVFAHEDVDPSDVRTHINRLLARDNTGETAELILTTGSETYRKAFGKTLIGKPLSGEEQRALSLTTTAGGFAVPYTLDPTVIPTSNGNVNPLRAISRVETISGNEWRGISSAGVVAAYSAEATETTDNAPTIAQPTLNVEKAQAFIPFSIEIGQDWGSLEAEMAGMLADAKDDLEAVQFITGIGHAGNVPEGLLVGGTAIVSTTAATTLAVGDLYKLIEALPPRYVPRARIVSNKAQFHRVRQLDTAGGANLWVQLGDGNPPQLVGFPAHEESAMSSALTSAASIITIGDFSNFLIVDKVGLTVELLPHLLGSNRRPTGQRGLYAYWRNSTKVLAWQAFRTLKVT